MLKPSAILFYGFDYLFKGLLLIYIIYSIKKGNLSLNSFTWKGLNIGSVVGWTLLLIIIGIFIDQVLWRLFASILPDPSWSISFPPLSNKFHMFVDLTIGIGFVAIVEEYIFRIELAERLKAKLPIILAVVLGSIIFGLSHWAFGINAVVTTAIWGILPIVSYYKLGTIFPAIIAHFITDVVSFSGILNGFF